MSEKQGTEVPPMDVHATMVVGVVVERRKAKSQWQDYVWQPVEVLLQIPPIDAWAVMRDADNVTRYYAGQFKMELHRPETVSYRENLISERPGVYVVLRSDSAMPHGMRVELVTPSPADAEAYLASGDDIVDRVPMPELVFDWLAAYVDAFHVDEVFHKRRRDKAGRRQGGGPSSS